MCRPRGDCSDHHRMCGPPSRITACLPVWENWKEESNDVQGKAFWCASSYDRNNLKRCERLEKTKETYEAKLSSTKEQRRGAIVSQDLTSSRSVSGSVSP